MVTETWIMDGLGLSSNPNKKEPGSFDNPIRKINKLEWFTSSQIAILDHTPPKKPTI